MVQALNSIDAVFAHDPAVREAWTRYHTTLNDQSLNTALGSSIREEKRRDLLLEIVKSLGLTRKISSADLLRTYLPTFVAEENHVAWLERIQKRAALEEDLTRRHIPVPPCIVPAPVIPAQTLVAQPTGSPVGNGAEQPRWAFGAAHRHPRQNTSNHRITSTAVEKMMPNAARASSIRVGTRASRA
jgi:hypothetical protein